MRDAAFRTGTLRWLVGLGVVSFLGALLLAVFGPDMGTPPSSGGDTYSKSAIGHRAFADLLRALDIPVLTSRHASEHKLQDSAVLVLAEPLDCEPGTPRGEALERMLDAALHVLLVLPKWEARASRSANGWIQELEWRREADSRMPLRTLRGEFHLRRAPVAAGRPAQTESTWTTLTPTFPLASGQWLEGSRLRPLVSSSSGVLLGEVYRGRTQVLVLADPDLLCNGGLGLGENAPLLVEAIEYLRPEGGVVVIDETVHGHEHEPSIWRELFGFPLLLLVLHLGLTVGVLLWAGMRRFGSAAREAPALAPGRRSLIANTAELLRYRGRIPGVLARYLRTTLTDVQRALHAPAGLDGPALEAWLDRLGQRRGVRDRVADLRAAAGPHAGSSHAHLLGAADRIHRWRTEILHGPDSRTRPA